jgi:hypothetical protein
LAELAEHGVEAFATPMSPDGIRLTTKPGLTSWPLYKDGKIDVQDEGSQMIARLVQPRRGEMVCDFCAGAGGKTLALGALMRSTGRLYAFDVNEKRLSGINLTAAKTRKLLLEINHNSESINTALKELADFAKSRSAFLVDSEGEDYNYISPVFKGKLLSAEDRDYLMDMLLKYAVTGVKAENVVMVIPFKLLSLAYLARHIK